MRLDSLASLVPSALVVVAALPSGASADETARVSSNSHGSAAAKASSAPAISADGMSVVYESLADDLVAGDTNFDSDVFLFDRLTNATSLVSVSTGGAQGNALSRGATISGDGRYVAFESAATNLAADPNGAMPDVFLRDLVAKTTTLVSMDALGAGANGRSFAPMLNYDGSKLVFASDASNLVAGDTNGATDVFVYDVATGVITLASVNGLGVQGNGMSNSPVISGDGTVVAFSSFSTNFPSAGDVAHRPGVYAKSLVTGAIVRVDVDATGTVLGTSSNVGGLSSDGSLVLFDTTAALVSTDRNKAADVYLRDLVANTIERISVDSAGNGSSSPSNAGRLSGDGRFAIFCSAAPDLADGDTNKYTDVFVRDRKYGTTMRLSVGTYDEQGDAGAATSAGCGASTSADGTAVVFVSNATTLVAGDVNSASDVFVRTRSMTPASAVHYGVGYPGTRGIPTCTPDHMPARGSTVMVHVDNSYGWYTVGFGLIGYARTALPTHFGGALLVDATYALPITFGPYDTYVAMEVPTDWWADGLVVDTQVVELDPGALHGVSFTDGLEFTFADG